MNDLAVYFAKKECVIHSLLKHESIIELYEYAESPTEYNLFMEVADQGDYLSRKILEVITLQQTPPRFKLFHNRITHP